MCILSKIDFAMDALEMRKFYLWKIARGELFSDIRIAQAEDVSLRVMAASKAAKLASMVISQFGDILDFGYLMGLRALVLIPSLYLNRLFFRIMSYLQRNYDCPIA